MDATSTTYDHAETWIARDYRRLRSDLFHVAAGGTAPKRSAQSLRKRGLVDDDGQLTEQGRITVDRIAAPAHYDRERQLFTDSETMSPFVVHEYSDVTTAVADRWYRTAPTWYVAATSADGLTTYIVSNATPGLHGHAMAVRTEDLTHSRSAPTTEVAA